MNLVRVSPTRLCAVVLAVTALPAGAQLYTLTDLGTLPTYTLSRATGINNAGQVVGISTNDLAFGPDRAFLWDGGVLTDLGTLGGDESASAAINDGGVVVGRSDTAPGTSTTAHAFSWQGPTMTDLGTLGGSASWAEDINTNGDVVGGSRIVGNVVFYPTLWVGGVPQALSLLSGHWVGGARAINGSGQVVGSSTSEFSVTRAVLWDGGAAQDLGALPTGGSSEAFDINDAGDIVGLAWLGGASVYHAVKWQGLAIADLGTLPGGNNSRAYAINASGQVVGESWISDQPADGTRACLWEGGAPIDLNTVLDQPTAWILTEARDINDAGQIVATGEDDLLGLTHALLLTPAVVSLPGDSDGDGDVDLADYAVFEFCLSMSGPGTPPSFQSCVDQFDFDGDTDVDVQDFAVFAEAFTG